MTQTQLYLSLTIKRNGQIITLPLTPLLLAMWLMAAFPLMAAQVTQAMAYSTLTILSQTLLMVVMTTIFIKALAWGVRS